MPEKNHDEQARAFVGRKRSQKQLSLGQAFAEQRFTEDLAQNREDDRRKGMRDVTVTQTKVEMSHGKVHLTTYPREVADAKISSHFNGKGGKAFHVDPKEYVPLAPKPVPVVHPAKDKSPASACKPYQGETAEELKEWGDATKGRWAFRKPVRKTSDTPRDFSRYIRDRAAVRMYAAMLALKERKEWVEAGNKERLFQTPEHCADMRAQVDTYETWKAFKESNGVTLKRWVSAGKTIANARASVIGAKLQEPKMEKAGMLTGRETAREYAAKRAKEGTPEFDRVFRARLQQLNARPWSREVSDEVKQRFGRR